MDLKTVSSDDVIEAYRNMLADAHQQIAVLTAQIVKASRLTQEPEFQEAERLVRQRALSRHQVPDEQQPGQIYMGDNQS